MPLNAEHNFLYVPRIFRLIGLWVMFCACLTSNWLHKCLWYNSRANVRQILPQGAVQVSSLCVDTNPPLPPQKLKKLWKAVSTFSREEIFFIKNFASVDWHIAKVISRWNIFSGCVCSLNFKIFFWRRTINLLMPLWLYRHSCGFVRNLYKS